MNLLEAALAHWESGRAVLPTRQDKSPSCPKGWDRWFREPQTESEVRQLFSNGAHGLGVLLYPASNFVVLDFDGPHAEQAWQATGIELSETARSFTQSGGLHLTYKTPVDTWKLDALNRAVRLVKADCDCKKSCGVDLLLRGYSIEPPTPGYCEDPDFTIEDATIIQQEVIELALHRKRAANSSSNGAGRFDTASALRGVPEGERDVTVWKLACKLRSADVPQDIAETLILEAARNCEPPFSESIAAEKVWRAYERYKTNDSAQGAESPSAFDLSDLDNSQRFARIHARDVKFSSQLGWLIWDGKRFRRDDTQEVERRARTVVRNIYAEAADCPDKDRREALGSWAHKSENEQRLGAMVRLAQSEADIAVTAQIFDRDPWLLNCANGTLDLRTGKLRPFSRDDLISKLAPIDFEADAPCALWEKVLQKIFNGDFELATYVQKICGYALTGDTREQEFYLFYGLGANGKTTLAKTLLRVLGEYGNQSPVDTFLVKRNGGGIPNDLARLAGARLVVATESEANQRLAESLVKAVTGGDRIAARFLHKEFFEFEPSFKLILSTNHKPKIVGTDLAIWRRVRLIPFAVNIPEAEQDKELPTKLEAELSGILRWAVEGCLLWQRDGLKPPAAVTEASEAYKGDSDVLADFIAARCEIDTKAITSAGELYKAYAEWCEDQKDRERDRLSRVTFGQALGERGFVSERRWKGRGWRGIKLTEKP